MIELKSIGISCLNDQAHCGAGLFDRATLIVAIVSGTIALASAISSANSSRIAKKSLTLSEDLHKKEVFLQKLLAMKQSNQNMIDTYVQILATGAKSKEIEKLQSEILKLNMNIVEISYKIENIDNEDTNQNLYTERDLETRIENYKKSKNNPKLKDSRELTKKWLSLRDIDLPD